MARSNLRGAFQASNLGQAQQIQSCCYLPRIGSGSLGGRHRVRSTGCQHETVAGDHHRRSSRSSESVTGQPWVSSWTQRSSSAGVIRSSFGRSTTRSPSRSATVTFSSGLSPVSMLGLRRASRLLVLFTPVFSSAQTPSSTATSRPEPGTQGGFICAGHGVEEHDALRSTPPLNPGVVESNLPPCRQQLLLPPEQYEHPASPQPTSSGLTPTVWIGHRTSRPCSLLQPEHSRRGLLRPFRDAALLAFEAPQIVSPQFLRHKRTELPLDRHGVAGDRRRSSAFAKPDCGASDTSAAPARPGWGGDPDPAGPKSGCC